MSTPASTPISRAERQVYVIIACVVLIVLAVNTMDFSASSPPAPPPVDTAVSRAPKPSPAAGTLPYVASARSSAPSMPALRRVPAAPATPAPLFDGMPYLQPVPLESRGLTLEPTMISASSSAARSSPSASAASVLEDRYYPPMLAKQELRGYRFLIMAKNVPPGLGLSTQLLTYLQLVAVAQLARRTLIFPLAKRTTFFQLINMTASTFPGPAPLSFVSNADTAVAAMQMRPSKKQKQRSSGGGGGGGANEAPRPRFKWNRELTNADPGQIRSGLLRFLGRYEAAPVLRVPTMFKMYPFGAPEEQLNLGKLICGLVFHRKIEEAAKTVRSLIPPNDFDDGAGGGGGGAAAARYVSLHLRIEPQDSVAFRRGAPSAAQLLSFLRNSVAPICAKFRTRNVFVASGPLGAEHDAVLKRGDIAITATATMLIWTKQNLLARFGNSKSNDNYKQNNQNTNSNLLSDPYFSEANTTVNWHRTNIYPTNTRTAAVDMLVLQHGAAAVMTAFSSLTPVIYSRRCMRGPQCLPLSSSSSSSSFSATAASTLPTYLYEVGDDGAMTKTRLYACGYRMQEILRGGGIVNPPASEDLFAENVRPNRMKLFE